MAAPVLGGDRAITVAEGGTVAVTTADLSATDADSTDSELVYTVSGARARHGAEERLGDDDIHAGGPRRECDLV
ncbi:MAG: cadherin-like domain-containing protein [Microvirga sp.]|jgi:hypothetical protein